MGKNQRDRTCAVGTQMRATRLVSYLELPKAAGYI